MKIIQSFWSKPSFMAADSKLLSRNAGGWKSPKYHYLSWCLSCLQLKQNYDEVELFTDTAGKELLIDILQLPYTKVHLTLNSLAQYDTAFWAIGKLIAYLQQTKPFIHVDSDVYIWKQFPDKIHKADLAVQGIETEQLWVYEGSISYIKKANEALIPEIMRVYEKNESKKSLSAGIFGGNNLDFIHDYSQKGCKFFDALEPYIAQLDIPKVGAGMINLVGEQYYAWCLAQQQDITITPLINDFRSTEACSLITNFMNVYDNKTSYIHLAGKTTKHRDENLEILEKLVKNYYPVYYDRVESFVNNLEYETA